MDRRGFLAGILALGAAPAIVRIGSLMPVRSIVIPTTEQVFAVASTAGNGLLTMEMITKEALRILNDNLHFTSAISKEYAFDITNDATVVRVGARGYRR